MTIARDTWWMVVRQARNLQREPVWVVLLVIQPVIWLVLYGQLFSRKIGRDPSLPTSTS